MSARRVGRVGGFVRIVAAVARHPRLWLTAFSVARRHIGNRWWKRWPFLPRPAGAYLAFRMETQYGGRQSLTSADPDDVLKYLMWVKTWRLS